MGAIEHALVLEEPDHGTSTQTTLYEMIEAISEEVRPGEEGLIATVVMDLHNRGLIKIGSRMRRYLSQYN